MVKDDKVVEVSTPLGPCNCLTVLGVWQYSSWVGKSGFKRARELFSVLTFLPSLKTTYHRCISLRCWSRPQKWVN